MIAGTGLIVCGLLGVLWRSLLGTPGADVLPVVGDVVYAAAVLLFAIGLSHPASVVARRPLGVGAMAVVALWPLAAAVITRVLPTPSTGDETAWMVLFYLSLLVPIGAGLVAAVQIARARVVRSPWRWAPLWVLGAQAGIWVISQIAFLAGDPAEIQTFAGLFSTLGQIGFLANTLGLGILALVLAARERPSSVEVFRSQGV